MTTKLHGFRRKAYAIVAVAVAATTGLSALVPQFAAAGQATERMVQMSDSTPGATNVTYLVSFKPTSTTNIGAIVVDFCGDSPIIGNSSCTYPSAFDLGAATPTFTGPTGFSTSTGTWVSTNSLTGAATNKQVLILSNSTPQTPTGTSTPITFTITGVKNPNLGTPPPLTTTTFFARIATFDTEAHATAGYTAPTTTTRSATTTTTGLLDYGGAAMNVNTQISITAKVQESLTFCASGIDISNPASNGNNSCTQATAPVIEIGHGGPPLTLDSSRIDNATIYTQMSTNASAGAIVRMKATNTCPNGGLSSTGGASCNIPGLGNSAAAAIVAGTANFGLFVSSSATTTAVPSSSGTITPDGNYHDAGHVDESTPDLYYGMDTETTVDSSSVLTTYGDPIMACAAPVSQVNNHLVFGATASLTTQAGIYTANEILIATGTF